MKAMIIRLGLAAVVAFGLVGLLTPATSAAPNTSYLYIHTLKCNTQVDDLFEDCHNRRVEGFRYTAVGIERASNWNGTVKYGPGGPRDVSVALNLADYSNYEGAYVFCENQTTGETLVDGPLVDPASAFMVNLQPGERVFCDVYLYTH